MELSYDEIRRIYRLEKNTSRLVEVGEDFLNALNDFVKGEKEGYLKSLKDASSDTKARNYANLRKMVEEIFNIREKKLLNYALMSSRTGETDEEHMALQEKETYRELLKVLKRHKGLLDNIFVAVSPAEKSSPKGKDLNRVSVRILKDIPSFLGTDMKEYGPFSAGQAVKLPFKISRLLVSRKIGRTEE